MSQCHKNPQNFFTTFLPPTMYTPLRLHEEMDFPASEPESEYTLFFEDAEGADTLSTGVDVLLTV